MGWLFDTEEFVTRNHCGPGWTPVLIYIFKFSNLVIALSYFSIPMMMMAFWSKRRHDVTKAWILVLFALFIFLCGWTHFNDILVFYWPAYRFYTLIYMLTGFVSFATACLLPQVLLSFLKLPSRDLVHKLNGELNKLVLEKRLENETLDTQNKKLINQIQLLETMLETNAWMHDKGIALKELKEMLLTLEARNLKDETLGN